jgi:hypothetical protein
LVDLGGREQELPRRRLDVLRFQVEEAKREHSLEGGAEDAEGISPDFIVPRDPRQDGERLRCVQIGRDRFVEPLQVAAPGPSSRAAASSSVRGWSASLATRSPRRSSSRRCATRAPFEPAPGELGLVAVVRTE